ncbi:MAG: PHP domain-containing protein [bacterium]|nr:PHP domain-containing protein [bacterium]
MKHYRADLHIHTCLSPCAEIDMTPLQVVNRAVARELDIIAVTDHNSAENAGAAIRAAIGKPLLVLPGMEITSLENVHVLAVFPGLEKALEMQAVVYDHMEEEMEFQCSPEEIEAILADDPEDAQVVVNHLDEILDIKQRFLRGAIELTLEELEKKIHRLGGLVIAAHIDRETFGIFGQLGYIPDGFEADALEVSRRSNLRRARKNFPAIEAFPLITSSDAHSLYDIGTSVSRFLMDPRHVEAGTKEGKAVYSNGSPPKGGNNAPGSALLEEMRWALHGEGGRAVEVEI